MSAGPLPRILVTDAGRGSALAIIRSLGRRGWHVVAADADRGSPGFHSRYASGRVRYPSPAKDAAATVDRLHAAAIEHGIDLIIPVTDEVLLPLSEARDRFAGVCALAIPSAEALAVVGDKAATLELAARLGIPVPRSCLVTTAAEAIERAVDFRHPIVVKPVTSRVRTEAGAMTAFSVSYADGPASLGEAMAGLEGRTAALLQEYCPGEAYGVELLLADGRPVEAFQHHRLREVPFTGGASAYRESVPLDPILLDYAVRLLAELQWTGLAMVEFKVGPDGPRLMEINGRVWGSLPLAVRCGIDFPAGLAELILDGPTPGVSDPSSGYQPTGYQPAGYQPAAYPTGIRMHNLDLEIAWILSVLRGKRRHPFLPIPPRRAAFGAALGLMRPGALYDVQTWTDPRPGLADVARIARKLVGKLAAER